MTGTWHFRTSICDHPRPSYTAPEVLLRSRSCSLPAFLQDGHAAMPAAHPIPRERRRNQAVSPNSLWFQHDHLWLVMSKRHPLRDNVDLPEENGDPPEWRWRSSAVIADDDFQFLDVIAPCSHPENLGTTLHLKGGWFSPANSWLLLPAN